MRYAVERMLREVERNGLIFASLYHELLVQASPRGSEWTFLQFRCKWCIAGTMKPQIGMHVLNLFALDVSDPQRFPYIAYGLEHQ